MQLRIYKLWREDVFKDIARIPEQDRGAIREGSVCKVTVNGHSKLLIIRGLEEQLNGGIMFDDITRQAFKVQEGMRYDVQIEPVGFMRQIIWACTVADAGPRIAAWLAVISVGLGLVGLTLGIIGLIISFK
jgi:hypothetical protein